MGFKFKEVLEESIIYFYDRVLSCNEYTEDVFEELDHVYSQAAKADEYEAKAKAFDYILGKKNEVEDDIYKFAVVREESAYQYLGYEVFKFIDEYESGEPYAKK